MRQDRNPKPRPPGFRNNFSFGGGNSAGGNSAGGNSLGGNSLGGNSSSGNSGRQFERPRFQQSRPPAPRAAKPRSAPGPRPVAKTPDRWKERRQMLKAAAWRFAKIVHKSPAAVIAAPNPAELIRVPDTKARQLAKKIVRLRNSRKTTTEK